MIGDFAPCLLRVIVHPLFLGLALPGSLWAISLGIGLLVEVTIDVALLVIEFNSFNRIKGKEKRRASRFCIFESVVEECNIFLCWQLPFCTSIGKNCCNG